MLTLSLKEKSGNPLYEQIYYQIRQNIVNGMFKPGEKLPSKRKLAEHLQVSVSTIENAYSQLLAEGYIRSVEKTGYFVRSIEAFSLNRVYEKIEPATYVSNNSNNACFCDPIEINSTQEVVDNYTFSYLKTVCEKSHCCMFDMKTNMVDTSNFPFSVWTKLMREALRDEQISLLTPSHPQGDLELRQEIANYLKNYRNMDVFAEQIILGAGTEYLLGVITELFTEPIFAVEDPCYHKQAKILRGKRMPFHTIQMDEEGISINELRNTRATVAIITPSRHFPLGTVMSINRRMQILKWAYEDGRRFLIEDDFDSEYRYMLKQIPALHSMDVNGKVIYMNTFARTLSPSLRIGYMVLPVKLLERYKSSMMFYSCTVSKFEQSTLRRFLRYGYYERHVSRMRQIYKNRRDTFLDALAPVSDHIKILGHEAGLHLLIKSLNGITENDMVKRAENAGIKIYGLSNYYAVSPGETNTVIVGYGGFEVDKLRKVANSLARVWT